jgi:rhodanese-related sulfurtransferase
MGNSNSIDSVKAKEMISNNEIDIILDVRSKEEWNEGHYPNAIHIPVENVETKFPSKYPDINKKILVYCKSGMRASRASSSLDSLGYKNVYTLNSGYNSLL